MNIELLREGAEEILTAVAQSDPATIIASHSLAKTMVQAAGMLNEPIFQTSIFDPIKQQMVALALREDPNCRGVLPKKFASALDISLEDFKALARC